MSPNDRVTSSAALLEPLPDTVATPTSPPTRPRPVAVEPPPETETPAAPHSRRPIAIAVVVALALLGISLGVRQYLWARTHVSTDNAQVEGHVVPVLAKVTGFVTAVPVIENQSVKAGDLLVQLDDREYQAKLEQNQADLAAALATTGGNGRVGQAVAQLAVARAAVAQAQANADRAAADAERYRALDQRGVVSRQEVDAAEAAAAASAAQLRGTQDQVVASEAALHGADAKVASARAQRDQAALNVAWTRIAAPTAGITSKKNVEVGQLVATGQPLMSVVPLDDVWVVANLKETEIAGVDPGDRAEIEVDAYPGRRFPARVESLAAATGAKFSLLPPDNATGNFTKVVQRIPVRLRLEGPQDPIRPLRPGMSVRATIATR